VESGQNIEFKLTILSAINLPQFAILGINYIIFCHLLQG
jgi:hypothetical protein